MGKKKEVVLCNGRYCGKYLNEQDCRKLDALRALSDDNGVVDDLKHVIVDLTPHEVDIVRQSESSEFVEPKRGTLTDSQTVGVAYMYFARRMLLGDSVGTGKTVEVAGLCNLLSAEKSKVGGSFRFLMLTNKTVLDETCTKMIRFTGEYAYPLYGEKRYIEKFVEKWDGYLPPNVVGAHSLLKSTLFQDYLISYVDSYGYFPFDILIVDESGDVLTNTKTQYYKEGTFLAKYFDRIILLNATPFEKELQQFYAQLNFLDDTLLPTKTEFSKTYEIMDYTRASYPVFSGKYRNAEQFMQLVGYRYLKRTRKDTGAVMIDCSAELYVSELSKEQKALLKEVSMPSMVYDCPSYFAFSGLETNEHTTPKLKDLLDLVNKRFKDEPSILVYTRYKESQRCIKDVLSKHGVSVEYMNGETSIKERNKLIFDFSVGAYKVLVTNVQKGLDFGNCNVCIFYDYDPNPGKMVQFEGRSTRSFDIIGKTVILLVSKGKELNTLREVVADRAQSSDLFSGSDFSCVLSILADCKELRKGEK